MAIPLVLSPSSHRAFERMSGDLMRVLGPRFVALVAYHERASAAFVSTIQADDLESLGALVESWHRDGLATPLLLTPDEFTRSLDVFPLEYQAMLDHHVVIAGRSPFGGVAVGAVDLRRACERHAKGHLIHLRQGWLQAAGHKEDVADLIEHSAAPLRALLTNVARLLESPASTHDDLAAFADQTLGVSREIVSAVLALEAAPEGAAKLVGRMDEYLAATESLWAFVDRWKSV